MSHVYFEIKLDISTIHLLATGSTCIKSQYDLETKQLLLIKEL